MKLIKPSVEIRVQEAGEDGMFEHIEWAGRHCYKSHDKTTSDSARKFVANIAKSGHGSVLEHGTIYLAIPDLSTADRYRDNPYSKVNIVNTCDEFWFAVTTNYRVIVENNWDMDLLYDCSEPTPYHEKRITAKFVCDRGVSHEFVRSRSMSFSQESQRYCNYNKDKFGAQVTFIKPSWWDTASQDKENFKKGLEKAEEAYLNAVKAWDERKPDKRFKTGFKGNPLSPQMARMILPNATKTELVMTGFESDWKHFFELRCSPAAHPDARYLANKLKSLITKQTENDGN
jgi:thymidylate synthase (FAD)